MSRKTLILMAAGALLLLPALSASASPYFQINTLEDWQTALGGGGGGGAVVAVDANDFEAMMNDGGAAWPSAYLGAIFSTPELSASLHHDGGGVYSPALVMQWQDPGGMVLNQYYAAAWDYEYALDPDLSGGGTLEFSIHAPQESWYVSINLIDAQGDYMEWIWHVGNNPGEIPPCTWTTVTVNPSTGETNYTLTTLFTATPDPGDPLFNPANPPDGVVDLDQITKIRFDENGRWSPWFDVNNGSFGIPNGMIWNAWDHVAYTPEPGVLSILGAGLFGLFLRRRT